MKKIPTIFDRDWDGDRSRVLDKPHADCAWVFEGLGVPTSKLDGTCCLIKDGKLYKRREIKVGQIPPEGFELISVDPQTWLSDDALARGGMSRKAVGWVPVGDGPEDAHHREGFAYLQRMPGYRNADGTSDDTIRDGTYELIGPKVQGNPEKAPEHQLVPHHSLFVEFAGVDVPRTFDGIRAFLTGKDIEGIVFHHPDGRMGKIKLRDFGLKRGG